MTDAQVQARIAIERKLIAFLLSTAREAGWAVHYVFDGGEKVRCADDDAAMDAVFSVDESMVVFTKSGIPGRDNPSVQSVRVVLGNDGYDAIADNSTNPVFLAEVMDKVDAFSDALCEEVHG